MKRLLSCVVFAAAAAFADGVVYDGEFYADTKA